MSPRSFRYGHQRYEKALKCQENVLERVLVLEFQDSGIYLRI